MDHSGLQIQPDSKASDPLAHSMPLVVNCDWAQPGEKGGFETRTRYVLRWLNFSARDPLNIPVFGRIGKLQRLSACLRTAFAAKKSGADIVVTSDPSLSCMVQRFLRLFSFHGPHLAFTFNHPRLPVGLKRAYYRWGFRGIDRFVVFSTMERKLYHEYFNIPLERLEFIHWGVAPPRVDSVNQPYIDGDYICAVGGNARDYKTLVESVKRLPEVSVVMVVRPNSLAGIDIPPNISVMTEIPWGKAMNIIAYSQFMVLPLDGSDVPCGHMTIVSAMHLGKAIAITRSTGIADYVREGENALIFSAGSVDEMTEVLRRMWYDRELCGRLGEAGRAFAAEHCSEAATLAGYMRILRQLGVRLEAS